MKLLRLWETACYWCRQPRICITEPFSLDHLGDAYGRQLVGIYFAALGH